jgi:hypothetical protein
MNARPPESWENWPTAGGMRNGFIFRRPKWAPAMSESDGFVWPGAWPTPDCNTSTYSNGHMGQNIREAASMWMTPKAITGGANSQREQRGAGGPDLQEQVQTWPVALDPSYQDMTPEEAKRVPTGHTNAYWLRMAAKEEELGITPEMLSRGQTWPTPAARDAKGANSSEHVMTNGTGRMHMDQLPNFVEHHFLRLGQQTPSGETSSTPVVSVHGAELSPTTRPGHVLGRLRLNPAFVCWLMGWPWWWTNPGVTSFARAEMVLYRSALQQRLCIFFGSQA